MLTCFVRSVIHAEQPFSATQFLADLPEALVDIFYLISATPADDGAVDDEMLLSDDFRHHNLCLICRRILAAPVLTHCSHSFCAICLLECIKMQGADGADCPTCKTSLIGPMPVFERSYSNFLKMQMEIMLVSSPRALGEWRARVAASLAARPPLHDSTEASPYDLLRPPKSCCWLDIVVVAAAVGAASIVSWVLVRQYLRDK